MEFSDFIFIQATDIHASYAEEICNEMAESAKARGTGIARRTPEYLIRKMGEGKAVIALHRDGRWAGFCYIETFSNDEYVANSGLIVSPEFRKFGLAKAIKKKVFELSRTKYPKAKVFGLTTGFAVMKINSDLGYEPVPYSELTQDEEFWKGCQSCVNYEILQSKGKKNCLCTAMLWDPVEKEKELKEKIQRKAEAKERLKEITKKASLFNKLKKKIGRSAKLLLAIIIVR